jgi:hypothetical protein
MPVAMVDNAPGTIEFGVAMNTLKIILAAAAGAWV